MFCDVHPSQTIVSILCQSPGVVHSQSQEVYQEISENSFETNWEFLSVEDMKEKGWSENLGFRIKRAMLDFVLPVLGPILE